VRLPKTGFAEYAVDRSQGMSDGRQQRLQKPRQPLGDIQRPFLGALSRPE
jgi:hypothetical protein